MGIKGFTKALAVVGFSAFSSIASADFIQTFPGNDCAGTFGIPFASCKIPLIIDPNESPIIIKFDFDPETDETTSDQFRAVSDDRRQRIRLPSPASVPSRDLDVYPGSGRSVDQFLCRERWKQFQPLQQPGRSKFRRLGHTAESRRQLLNCRTCRSTTRRRGSAGADDAIAAWRGAVCCWLRSPAHQTRLTARFS